MSRAKKTPKVSAEFHTADGIRSVCHKNWPWPPPPIWRRGLYPDSMAFAFAEADLPAYMPNFREYHIERVEHGKRGPKKIIYREQWKRPPSERTEEQEGGSDG